MSKTLLFAIVGITLIIVPYIDFSREVFTLPKQGLWTNEYSLNGIVLLIIIATYKIELKKRLTLFFVIGFFLWLGETIQLIMAIIGIREFPLNEIVTYAEKIYTVYKGRLRGEGAAINEFGVVLNFFLHICMLMGIVLGVEKVFKKYIKDRVLEIASKAKKLYQKNRGDKNGI